MSEKLIKSKERVNKFGEVFTPSNIVNDMLDLIPNLNISQTFLEPACGNGNFLIEILSRKLLLCKNDNDIIRSYASIYGIDIQEDNVIEARKRMLDMLPSDNLKESISNILIDNIVVNDFLNTDIDELFYEYQYDDNNKIINKIKESKKIFNLF